ncbi:MAG: BrnT family toxin [Lachnospiraceae bacterium]|nr:BrnT family toxin [Lachnospiraceae bacterium]
MGKEELIEKLRSICDLYSDILGTVILFGSYSRNEAGNDSDIDLYIEPKDRSLSSTKFGSNKRYREFKFALYDAFSKEFDLLVYGGKIHSDEEDRYYTIGKVGDVLFVVYTDRGNTIRLISARFATKKEEELYYGNS